MKVSTDRGTRVGWVDAVRGLAVLLMVVDHLLVQVDPASPLRYTLTRASLPLFMVASAAVPVGRSTWRRLSVLLVLGVLVETPLTIRLGMAIPGPVLIIGAVLVLVQVAPIVRYRPGIFAFVGLVQALYLPLPGFAGYQPGLVLAYWCIGRACSLEFAALGTWLPSWVAAIGRRPLVWYFGHLAVLVVVFA